ncbi:NACHT domain-containing protein [Limnoraphis robusta Tam1]|uniref:NACHT domain-containing protein n=1 Tax=Limnoraphis robusta TaxID=1118279 RepID=UPI002B1FA49B|nr:NACHT domain-containing protein [Limnoraphis robusta]MEA5542079.1 NACHT domain-containing protein [Limnoraphis robusta Tam1]
MSEQPIFNPRLNIDAQTIENSPNGQAGRDLFQTVTVYESLSFEGLFRREVKPPTQQEYRFRQKLLNQVKEFWVENVLERSLHNLAIIELGLEERPDLVERPFSNVQISPDESKQSLSIHRGITTAFNRMGEGRTLLILGEPGAGKTTVLLKLTRDLIDRTSDNLNRPIPVVFNLSSWAKKQQKIADWLVDELQSNYGVSKSLGKAWVKDQQLLLLLDGLDEVRAKHREACVEAINQFMKDYGVTEMVVCSRIKDYQALSNRLQLRGAICVQPLTSKHINQYLDEAGEQLQGVKTLLQQDTAMQEMMKSPLTLSIVSMAYKDISIENLQQFGSIKERRRHLFETYIERMFQRHGRAMRMKYTPEKTKHWLTWLATRMVQESQTVFLIEKIQPSWLEKKGERIFYRIASALALGLMYGLINGLMYGLIFGLTEGLIFGLIFGLIGGKIKTIESLKWSSQEFKNSLKTGLIALLMYGLIALLMYGLIFRLMYGLNVGLMYGLIFGVSYTIIQGLKGPEIETKNTPNQGIKKSVFNALIFGIIIGFVAILAGIILVEILDFFQKRNDGISLALVPSFALFGLTMGLAFGGGYAVIQHFTLRLRLYKNGFFPWNYARFLDYATELIFLQKVGGGYIFIHRMLLEHFAQVETEQVPESSVKVSQSIDFINASTVQEFNPVNSEEVETSETVEALEPELVSNKICGNCQHENLPHFNFCSKCGTALNSDSISN